MYSVESNFTFDVETERIIDDYVENVFMRNSQIPGLGLSIVRNGTVLMSKGYGFRNISAGQESDGNTLFSIASNSKVFTVQSSCITSLRIHLESYIAEFHSRSDS